MKNKKLIIGISAAAAVLVVGGGIWFALGRDGSGNDENVVYVTTVESLTSQGNVAGALNRFAGVVETQEKLEIQPNQEKTVKEIYVEEGQEVVISERSAVTRQYTYLVEPSVAMSGIYRTRQRIRSRKGKIQKIEKTQRGYYLLVELDE